MERAHVFDGGVFNSITSIDSTPRAKSQEPRARGSEAVEILIEILIYSSAIASSIAPSKRLSISPETGRGEGSDRYERYGQMVSIFNIAS